MKKKQTDLRIDGLSHNKATANPNSPNPDIKIEGKLNPNTAQKDLDWKGFLDWSSKQNDGTLKSQVSPEEVKWFENAMKAMINSQLEEIKNSVLIVDQQKDIEKKPELKDKIVDAIENIFDIVESGIEQSRDLVRIGMHQPLIQAQFECRDRGIKNKLSIVFNSILQNNNYIKEQFIKENVHTRLFANLAIQNNPKEMEFDINFLNGLTIGQFKPIYDQCIDNINILVKIVDNIGTEKSQRRQLTIIRNLMECNPTKHVNLNYLASNDHLIKIKNKELGKDVFEEQTNFLDEQKKKK